MAIKYFPRMEGIQDLESNIQAYIADPDGNSPTALETTIETIINVLQAYGMVI